MRETGLSFGYKPTIYLIPKWLPINYTFVCMLISPLRLVIMCKKQKNFEVKMRRRGLINMQTKEQFIGRHFGIRCINEFYEGNNQWKRKIQIISVSEKRRTLRAVFKWLSKIITWLRLLRLVIGLKESHQFFNQWESKPKPIAPRTRDFSRASSELQITAKNCNWFIALPAPVVIGRSDSFGFGFSTVIWKPLYSVMTHLLSYLLNSDYHNRKHQCYSKQEKHG